MAHDQPDEARQGSTDAGPTPGSAGAFAERTALSPSVTATTPQPDLGARPRDPGYSAERPAGPGYSAERPAGPHPEHPAGPAGPATATWPAASAAPSRTRRGVILLVCAVVGTGIGVGTQRMTGGGHAQALASRPKVAAAPTPVSAQVSSFNPIGSGFRKQDGSWRSQTYTSAKFGNLKPGIGLLLDLGSAHALQSVTLGNQTGLQTVELRAGDSRPGSADDFQRAGNPLTAPGATLTLPATSGGSHRYWLVWVTSLAPSGPFQAVIGTVTAKG